MLNKIGNIEILTNFFGYTPNFHDAEILKVTLDRNGPEINMDIIITEISEGKEKACIVTLKFENVYKMELQDFNIQNVIFEIKLLKLKSRIKTIFESSYGLSGFIISLNVIITNLIKLNE
jgi:hypothetical protein